MPREGKSTREHYKQLKRSQKDDLLGEVSERSLASEKVPILELLPHEPGKIGENKTSPREGHYS